MEMGSTATDMCQELGEMMRIIMIVAGSII